MNLKLFFNHVFFQRPPDCELTSPDVVHTCFPVKNLTMNNSLLNPANFGIKIPVSLKISVSQAKIDFSRSLTRANFFLIFRVTTQAHC